LTAFFVLFIFNCLATRYIDDSVPLTGLTRYTY